QAIEVYVQDLRALGREPKTVQWHQTSLGALQQYLWSQFHSSEVAQLSGEVLHCWVADLSTRRSPQTGAGLSVNTIAAYARSARAFCSWLVRQGALPVTSFPKGSLPHAPRCLPQLVEPKAF